MAFNARNDWQAHAPGQGPPAGYLPLPGFENGARPQGDSDTYITSQALDAIADAVRAGLGIMVSKTTDGGAISLVVYAGNQRYRHYAGNPDDADAMWDALRRMAEGERSTLPAAPSGPPLDRRGAILGAPPALTPPPKGSTRK